MKWHNLPLIKILGFQRHNVPNIPSALRSFLIAPRTGNILKAGILAIKILPVTPDAKSRSTPEDRAVTTSCWAGNFSGGWGRRSKFTASTWFATLDNVWDFQTFLLCTVERKTSKKEKIPWQRHSFLARCFGVNPILWSYMQDIVLSHTSPRAMHPYGWVINYFKV